MYVSSVAVAEAGRSFAGAVACSTSGELWWAARGNGAWKSGGQLGDGGMHRIHVSAHRSLEGSFVGTGFPLRAQHLIDEYAAQLARMLRAGSAPRRGGSAALDLCYVAAGRLEGFWELKLHAWDVAAGALIVEEAGGRVSDLRGGPMPRSGAEVLASNGHVHAGMLEVFEHH
jgi:myo-inositol-1(or 4)-monophosphatase